MHRKHDRVRYFRTRSSAFVSENLGKWLVGPSKAIPVRHFDLVVMPLDFFHDKEHCLEGFEIRHSEQGVEMNVIMC